MRIVSIKLKNYKGFQNVELTDLPELAIFVGANGSGKSTLFDVFGFLSDALHTNVSQALVKRGGFKEVISRGQTGTMAIRLKFRLIINGEDRLASYQLEIGEENGKPYIEREILFLEDKSHGLSYHFLNFSRGEGYAILNEEDFGKHEAALKEEKQKLGSPDILAIKGFGQFDKYKVANAFREFIENWRLSDFQIHEARPSREAAYAEHLSANGENLPLVAQYIYENHPQIFKKILEKMKQRIPGISDVKAETTIDGRVVLRFQDGGFNAPFIAGQVSDGTIKMFAYLILLYDPQPHPLLCVEEPENQLYPHLLQELIEEFRAYAKKGGQVFLTSHSPDLLNGAKIEEVFWLVKENGYTKIKRASDDPKIVALVEAGDQLGYLWKENYLKNRHPF